jgi:hypothetical protein
MNIGVYKAPKINIDSISTLGSNEKESKFSIIGLIEVDHYFILPKLSFKSFRSLQDLWNCFKQFIFLEGHKKLKRHAKCQVHTLPSSPLQSNN